MATRRRKPLIQPETNSLETMEEEQQFNPEEITEIFSEIPTVEEPKVEELVQEKPVREVRTPPTPQAPKRHPRNIPKFSKPRNGN
jgi:seryl-tRNA synthetase